MRIINITSNQTIAENAVIAETLFARMRGLLGKSSLASGSALILKPCNSVHTFFMKFPIDVLFVNRHNQVIKTTPSLKPNRITPTYFHSSYTIELPAGTISSTSTKVGDILSLE